MKIFITYSRISKDTVLSLVKDIEQLGHSVWFDNQISGGQSWWDNILSNIRNCDAYIFALNKDSLNSTACRRELDYATALQKPTLPVLLSKDVSMAVAPRSLSNLQYVDYSNISDKNSVFSLLRAINSLPAAPLPDPLPTPPPVPISYLDNIKDKIDSPDLDKKDQLNLVSELQNKLSDPDNRKEDIYDLLRRLQRRDDLLASVNREIEQILNQQPAPKPNPPRPPYTPVNPNPPNLPGQTHKGWSTGLMIVLGFLSFIWPLGIIIGIIAFAGGATKAQAWTLMGIALGVMLLYFIGLELTPSNYNYDYY